jgi:integrase
MFVRPTVNGRYRAEARASKGPQVLKDSKSFDTKKAAQLWGEAREKEMREELEGGFGNKTVRELLERWRDEIAPERQGAKWDINRINAVLVEFSDDLGGVDLYKLKDFKPKNMMAYRRLRLSKVSPVSVARGESLLRTIWSYGRHPDWAWTDQDPFKDLGAVKGRSGVPRNRRGQWTEIKRILRQLDYHPRQKEANKRAQVGLAMLVALRTTLRSQEVLALNDKAIDLNQLVIQIEKHKTRYMTNEAKRVPLLPKALLLLSRKCLGTEGPYFTVANSSRDTFFREACANCNVQGLTFHDLKRTAVLWLKERLTMEELKTVTGNSDESILRAHYMTETAADASKIAWKAFGADKAKLLAFVAKRRLKGTGS